MPAPIELTASQWAELEAAYAQPPRAYHGFGHVRAVLEHVAEVAAGPGWQQPLEVWLAALFHDAVYVAGRSDNEMESALLARRTIARWWPQSAVGLDRVAELIALTARHGQLSSEQVDRDAGLFLDCDMAILAAPPPVFDAYDRGIAEEYHGHVPGWLFRRNRRRFLASLLRQPRIFLSDYFDARYDTDARANLRRTLGQSSASE